ncbi:MAG: energy-coupling factor ABC transporter ATP-binding protein [Lachnospiraceae bacterium]
MKGFIMIELKDICFSYDDRPVLKHIDLVIQKGETIILEGPNGCGKSTLIRILNGLEFPEIGEYWLDGKKIDAKSMKKDSFAKAFHQKIGYVFQNPDAQLFCPSVEEEIAFAPMQMGLSQEAIKERVEYCISLFELEELRKRAPFYLSTGEKKKTAMAAILSMNPQVLVLDEPLSGLDVETQEWLTEFLVQFKKVGKTMIIATHNPAFAQKLADRVVHINREHRIASISS